MNAHSERTLYMVTVSNGYLFFYPKQKTNRVYCLTVNTDVLLEFLATYIITEHFPSATTSARRLILVRHQLTLADGRCCRRYDVHRKTRNFLQSAPLNPAHGTIF